MPINSTSAGALFIDSVTLKTVTMINFNLDDSIVKPMIKVAQDIFLVKLLGTSLFADLQNKITAGTLNSDELFLLTDFIRPALAWKIVSKAGFYSTFKYTNKGVQTMSSDQSQPVSQDTLQYLADDAINNCSLYSDRLIRHLIANQSFFPAYRQMTNIEDIAPSVRPWRSNVALGNMGKYRKIGEGGGQALNLTPLMFAYLNTNKVLTATSHGSNTANFSGSFLAAPTGLPYTTVSNFSFYDNSTVIPPATIVSFVDNGSGTCILTVDTTVLGFSFQIGDVITAIGKFQ